MKLGFLGAGKMARALAVGLIKNQTVVEFTFSTRTEESRRIFAEACRIASGAAAATGQQAFHAATDNLEMVHTHSLIVLGIKPQQMAEGLPPLKAVSAGKLFLSLAAGVSLAKLQGWLGDEARIIRAMPNLPMQVGLGACVYAGGASVTPEDYALAHTVLSAGGKAWRVEESQIDAVTALSGSGPAYVFHFIEALELAGRELGLEDSLARELALQTVTGSAHLAAGSKFSAMELAAQVKSPGGTTLAGCAVLEENDALNRLMLRTLQAAKKRAEELGRC